MPIVLATFVILVLVVEDGGHSPEEGIFLLSRSGAVLGGCR